MGAFVTPLAGHLDIGLTNFVKRFQNNELFADQIAPRVPIPRQSDKYWIFGRESQNVLQQTLRAPGTVPQRIVQSLSNNNFFADSHALMAELPDESTYNFDLGDLRQFASADLMDKILLDKEIRLAAVLTSTTAVTNGVTLSGSAQYSSPGTSDPITDVETAKAAIRMAGVNANWILIGDQVYQKLVVHPSIVERFKYAQGGAVTEDDLAKVFGVPKVMIGSAVVLDKGNNASFVWGKNIVLGYVKSAVDEDGQPANRNYGDLSSCKSFVWTGAPGTIGGIGTIIERKQPQASKADLVSVDFYYEQMITAQETLYLIAAAVA
ncbi:MAG: hypothetical protein ACLP1Y_08410 [Candidatus Acidiferrales bacterium]